MKTQLLCTFTDKEVLQDILQQIRENYKIVYNYIYILQNKTNLDELYITYNIDVEFRPNKQLSNTILVHRKKQSNTLYTINALNQLIKEENGGILDTSFSLDWDKFRNCIILTGLQGIRKVPTRIFEKIEFN
jgi:hypothetical protein